MAKPRPAYGIDDEWRGRVRRALEAKGWDQADLANKVHCSPSVISDLLNGKKHQSPYVPAIAVVFGWTPPIPLTEDQDELMRLWNAMDDIDRGRLLERARAISEEAATKKRP